LAGTLDYFLREVYQNSVAEGDSAAFKVDEWRWAAHIRPASKMFLMCGLAAAFQTWPLKSLERKILAYFAFLSPFRRLLSNSELFLSSLIVFWTSMIPTRRLQRSRLASGYMYRLILQPFSSLVYAHLTGQLDMFKGARWNPNSKSKLHNIQEFALADDFIKVATP
jgi:hypothetical protein